MAGCPACVLLPVQDADYTAAGATVVDRAAALAADVVLKVGPWTWLHMSSQPCHCRICLIRRVLDSH